MAQDDICNLKPTSIRAPNSPLRTHNSNERMVFTNSPIPLFHKQKINFKNSVNYT